MLEKMEVSKSGDLFDGMHETVIKVIGCGGCGGNAVNLMIEQGVENVEFIALNTDLQALSSSNAKTRLGIGAKLNQGLGAGGDPTIGEKAATDDQDKITNCLKGADMVFVTAGMGGGTGTGSAPVVAKCARDLGALTVAVVTTPLDFEGTYKMSIAKEGIKKLREQVDALIVIPNQAALTALDKKIGFLDAFKEVNQILRMGVQGISDIITKRGLVNTDFADIKAATANQGDIFFGIGQGKGDNRAIEAATAAINNKLLPDFHIDGAKNIILNVFGTEQISLSEVNDIMNMIRESADPNAKIYWGQVVDSTMEDTISITVIATGFNTQGAKSNLDAKAVANKGNTVDYGSFEAAMGISDKKAKEGGNNTSVIKNIVAGESAKATNPIDPNDLSIPAYKRKNVLESLPSEIKLD